MEHIIHPLAPVYDERSRVLILGTMASPLSRKNGFYYGHPQNRFWKVLSAVFEGALPVTNQEKRSFALRHGVALWDVISECDIVGASDASIKNAIPNDIPALLQKTGIARIFTTGSTATKLYRSLLLPTVGFDCIPLPSPSPANCKMSLSALTAAYGIIKSEST